MINKNDNPKSMGMVILLILLLKLIPTFPWWGFLLPVTALAFLLQRLQWRVAYFKVGLASGSLIWILGNLIWDTLLRGHILSGYGPIVKIILVLVAGLIGGVLTGLAMLTGKYLAQPLKTDPGKA